MSLDVYLTVKEPVAKSGTGVFVRDNGQTRELTVEEVKEKWSTAEVGEQEYESDTVFDYNITHNLGKMAGEAGVYEALWRPEEKSWTKAGDLIETLEAGLKELKDKPEHYQQFNPENGWGSYDGLVEFVEQYLAKCKEYPEAEIRVSR